MKVVGCYFLVLCKIWSYNSMEGLRTAVYKKAEDIYNKRMLSAGEHTDDGFLNMGLTYIDFAKNEKNLFKLLFMSAAFREQSIMDIVGTTEGDDEALIALAFQVGILLVYAICIWNRSNVDDTVTLGVTD